jgi:hypothetical protein
MFSKVKYIGINFSYPNDVEETIGLGSVFGFPEIGYFPV